MMGRAHILVVEDNASTRRLFCRALSQHGHRAISAESIGKARRLIANEDLDLILLDLVLEREKDGPTLLKEVKRNPLKRHIPIVTITGHKRAMGVLARTLKRGAADCLTMPIDISVLQAKIDRVLADSRARRRDAKPREVGRIRIMPRLRRVFVDEREIRLSPREFQLLACLMRRTPEILTRKNVIKLCKYNERKIEKVFHRLDSTLSRLRISLGKKAAKSIVTRRGIGLQFKTQ